MFCSNCGAQLSEEASFCSNCGAPTSGTASATESATQTERTLYEVALPKGAIFWQGPGVKPHYFGDSQLTITNRRLILQSPEGMGGHGGDQQVLLRDITYVERENRLFRRRVMLHFVNPHLAFELDCKGKQEIDTLASMIEEALASA